ncbi:MAG: InlB B-repeat-containing protein, partial [Firmicutes bacterium]|nr:InlB B-repeat-containing protein [Bacillota bacterium]
MKKRLMTVCGCAIIAAVLSSCGMIDSMFGGKDKSGTGGKPFTATVTINPNGGTVDKLTLIGEAGTAMNLPTPTRAGYTFAGYYNDWSVFDTTVFPSANVTLTARYYAQKDTPRTINAKPTELNKIYGGDTSYNSFT